MIYTGNLEGSAAGKKPEYFDLASYYPEGAIQHHQQESSGEFSDSGASPVVDEKPTSNTPLKLAALAGVALLGALAVTRLRS